MNKNIESAKFLTPSAFLSIILQDFCKKHYVCKKCWKIYNVYKTSYKNEIVDKNFARKTISAGILQVSSFFCKNRATSDSLTIKCSCTDLFIMIKHVERLYEAKRRENEENKEDSETKVGYVNPNCSHKISNGHQGVTKTLARAGLLGYKSWYAQKEAHKMEKGRLRHVQQVVNVQKGRRNFWIVGIMHAGSAAVKFTKYSCL